MDNLLTQLCQWQHQNIAAGFRDDPAARAQLYNQIIQRLSNDGMCISVPEDCDVPRLLQQLCRDVGLGSTVVGCPAAKIIGALLREPAAVAKVTIDQQTQVLGVLCQVVNPMVTKEQVKVALWGLSCQCLSPTAVSSHLESLFALMRCTLPLTNAWTSVMITLHAVHLVSRLLLQVPQQVLERCVDWLPLIWPLLLACPPQHLYQDANRHKVYMELRTQASSCMLSAQQQLRSYPQHSQLEQLLAQQMMAAGGLLEQMKTMVDAAQVARSSGKNRPGSPTLITAALPSYAVPVAESAVHACSLYIQLLGGSLTRDIRRLGQPVLDLLKSAFTHTSSVQLPRASFLAWNHLGNAFAAAGTLSKRRKLLLQPIDYTLTHDKRKEVKLAALESWLHLVDACRGGQGTRQRLVDEELFQGVVVPVVEVVLGCKPGAQAGFVEAVPQVIQLLKSICNTKLLPAICDLTLRILRSSPKPSASDTTEPMLNIAAQASKLWGCLACQALSQVAFSHAGPYGVPKDDVDEQQAMGAGSLKPDGRRSMSPGRDQNAGRVLSDLRCGGWDGGGRSCHLCNGLVLKEQCTVMDKVQEVWKALVACVAGLVPAVQGSSTADAVEDAVRALVTAHSQVLQQVWKALEYDLLQMEVVVKQQKGGDGKDRKGMGSGGDTASVADQYIGMQVGVKVCDGCSRTAAAQMVQYCREQLQVLLLAFSGDSIGAVCEGEKTPGSMVNGGKNARSWVWKASASNKRASKVTDLDKPVEGCQGVMEGERLPLVGKLLLAWLEAAVQLHWMPGTIIAPAATSILETAGGVLNLREFLQLVSFCLSPAARLTPPVPAGVALRRYWESLWLKAWVLLCSPLTTHFQVCQTWRFPPETWPDMLASALDILDLPLHGPAEAEKQEKQRQRLNSSISIDLNRPLLPQESEPVLPSRPNPAPAADHAVLEPTSQQLQLLSQVSTCWVQLFEAVSACWVLWPQQAQQRLFNWAAKVQTMLEFEKDALEISGGAFLLLVAASACSVARFLSEHPLTSPGQANKQFGMARRSLTPGTLTGRTSSGSRGGPSPFTPSGASRLTPGSTAAPSHPSFNLPPAMMPLLCGLIQAAVKLDCTLLASPNNTTRECRENALTVLGFVLQCVTHLFSKAGNAQEASEQLQYLDPSMTCVFKHIHSLTSELQTNSTPSNAPATILACWRATLDHIRSLLELDQQMDGCLVCLQDALQAALNPSWPALFTCTFQLLDNMVSQGSRPLQLPAMVEQALAEAGPPETQMQDMQNFQRAAFRAAGPAQGVVANNNAGLQLNSQDLAIIHGRAPPLKHRVIAASQTDYVRIPPPQTSNPHADPNCSPPNDGPPSKRQKTLSAGASAQDCSTVVQSDSLTPPADPMVATEVVDPLYRSFNSPPGSSAAQGLSVAGNPVATTLHSAPYPTAPLANVAGDHSSGVDLQSKVLDSIAQATAGVNAVDARHPNARVNNANGSGDQLPSRGLGQSGGTGTGTSDGVGQEATSPPFPPISSPQLPAPIEAFRDAKTGTTTPEQHTNPSASPPFPPQSSIPMTSMPLLVTGPLSSIPPFSPLSSILPLSSIPISSMPILTSIPLGSIPLFSPLSSMLPLSSLPFGSMPPLLSMNPSGLFPLPSGFTTLDTLPPLDSALAPLDSHMFSPPNTLSNLDSLFGPGGLMPPPATPGGPSTPPDLQNARQSAPPVAGTHGLQVTRPAGQNCTPPQPVSTSAVNAAGNPHDPSPSSTQAPQQVHSRQPPTVLDKTAGTHPGVDLNSGTQNVLTPNKASASMRAPTAPQPVRSEGIQAWNSQSPNTLNCVHSEGQGESECSPPTSGQPQRRTTGNLHSTQSAGKPVGAVNPPTLKSDDGVRAGSAAMDGEVRSAAMLPSGALRRDSSGLVSTGTATGVGFNRQTSHGLNPCNASSQHERTNRPAAVMLPAALRDLPSITRPADTGLSAPAILTAQDAANQSRPETDPLLSRATQQATHPDGRHMESPPAIHQQLPPLPTAPPTSQPSIDPQLHGAQTNGTRHMSGTMSAGGIGRSGSKRSHARSESCEDGSICSSIPSTAEPTASQMDHDRIPGGPSHSCGGNRIQGTPSQSHGANHIQGTPSQSRGGNHIHTTPSQSHGRNHIHTTPSQSHGGNHILSAPSQSHGGSEIPKPTNSQPAIVGNHPAHTGAMVSPFQAPSGMQPMFGTRSNVTTGAALGDANTAGEVLSRDQAARLSRSTASLAFQNTKSGELIEPVASRQVTTEHAFAGDTTCVTSATQRTAPTQDVLVQPSGLSQRELSQLQEALDRHTSAIGDAGVGNAGEPSCGRGAVSKGTATNTRQGSGCKAVSSAHRQGEGSVQMMTAPSMGHADDGHQHQGGMPRTGIREAQHDVAGDAPSQSPSAPYSGSMTGVHHPAASTGLVNAVNAQQLPVVSSGPGVPYTGGGMRDDVDGLEINPTQDVVVGMPLAVQKMLNRPSSSAAQIRSSSLPTSAAMEAVRLMQQCAPTSAPTQSAAMLCSEPLGLHPPSAVRSHNPMVATSSALQSHPHISHAPLTEAEHVGGVGGLVASTTLRAGSDAGLGAGLPASTITRVGSDARQGGGLPASTITRVGSDAGAHHQSLDALLMGAHQPSNTPVPTDVSPRNGAAGSPTGLVSAFGRAAAGDFGLPEGMGGLSHVGGRSTAPAVHYPTRVTSNVMLLRKPPAGVSGHRSPPAQLPPAFTAPPSSLQPAIAALMRAPSPSGTAPGATNRKGPPMDTDAASTSAAMLLPFSPTGGCNAYADVDNTKYAHRTIVKAVAGITSGAADGEKVAAVQSNNVPPRLEKGLSNGLEGRPTSLERAVSFQLPTGANRFVPSGLRLMFPNKSIESNESCTAPRPKYGGSTDAIPTWTNTFGDNPAKAEAAVAAAAAAAAERSSDKGNKSSAGGTAVPQSGGGSGTARGSNGLTGLRRGSSGLGPGSVMGPPADVVMNDQVLEAPADDSPAAAGDKGDKGKGPHPLLQQLQGVLTNLQEEELEAQDVWMGHALSLSLANLFANRLFGARPPLQQPDNK